MLCPICKKLVGDAEPGGEGSTYPFCSDRCRLIDLGRWLSGKYQIQSDTEQTNPNEANTRKIDGSDGD